MESKNPEEIQLDGGACIPFIHRRVAEAFARAGLAEFDVDPPFQARMASCIIESCSDAAILRATRMEDGKTYHMQRVGRAP
jgi:hypothetical protein